MSGFGSHIDTQPSHSQLNQLAESQSPYLRQHQENPVNWLLWNTENLKKAKIENKPIFLSIGYSSCHWCHVMAHEAFSDQEVAQILNTEFIPIKVDREERPDIDHIYMTALQIMTGQGGWPLNIFLTPELRPFFGGTYFSTLARYGRPPFADILSRLSEAYRESPQDVKRNADQVMALLFQSSQFFESREEITNEIGEKVLANLRQSYEPSFGGLGGAPKFFHSEGLRFLLRQGETQKLPELKRMVDYSLEKMACGGVFDQASKGFHRYSTDIEWKVPHFEKMLYDNALLIPLYLEASKVLSKEFFRTIALETADWALREMRSKEGDFYSSIDADGEKMEGEYYTYTVKDLEEWIHPSRRSEFFSTYGITQEGNFENARNILWLQDPSKRSKFESELKILSKERSKKIEPHIDRKILTSWNSLMISALAAIGQDYLKAAEEAAQALLNFSTKDGEFRHSRIDGELSEKTFLEDYAYFCEAMLDLHSATHSKKYLDLAQEWAHKLEARFYDAENFGFWSNTDREDSLMRYKDIRDGALPAPYHSAVAVFYRLHRLTNEKKYLEIAENSVRAILGSALESPGGFQKLALVLSDV